jgi:phosphoribosyl 1,2-cyclic phosphodiesterase/ActR/RegA family two-component response regulator
MAAKKHKILIADADRKLHRLLRAHKTASQYHIESAYTGHECLQKIDHFKPDLILIDLLLPQIHGIEILRKVKTDPRTNQVGVFILCSNVMIQNYHSAIKQKADDFIEKPFDFPALFTCIHQFFTGKLKPTLHTALDFEKEGKHCYLPKLHASGSYLKFWGTRGSNPVSGPDYVRFGGNTCCLEVRHGSDLLVFDAGTGIRPFGTILEASRPKNVHLFFSHTHWDHLAGFPFFPPIYDPECTVTIYSPIGFEKTTREIFTEMLAYAYFPVRLDEMRAKLIFKDLHEGEVLEINNFEVNTHYAYHPGATLCFKIRSNKVTFGYVTDNELLMGYHGNPSLLAKSNPILAPYLSQIKFFEGCDFIIHEAQYTPQEYLTKVGWGHSSIVNATALIKHADISEWIITHHDPRHTDQELLKKMQMQFDILDDCKVKCRARMAFDGMIIPL